MNRNALGNGWRTPRGGLSRSLLASASVHAAVLVAGVAFGFWTSGGEAPSARAFTARFAPPGTSELPLEEPAQEVLEFAEPAGEREPELRESEIWSEPEKFAAQADEAVPASPLRSVDWLPALPFAIGRLDSGGFVAAAVAEPEPALAPQPAVAAPPPAVVVAEPVPLENPPPAHPPLARRSGEEGSVLCRLRLDAEGAVVAVEIVESSGSERLDRAAKQALAGWRFEPRREDGRAVAASLLHRVTFRLSEG